MNDFSTCTISKCVYFSLRAWSCSSSILANLYSFVRALNFAGTTRSTSRFLFPETLATNFCESFVNHLPSKNCSSDLIVRWEHGPPTSSVRFLMEFCCHANYSFVALHCLTTFVFHWLCHVITFVSHRSLLKSIHRLCHVTAFVSQCSLLIEYWVFLWINILFKFIGFFYE